MVDERVRYVTTRTPLRVSFAGGGTDLPAFYEQDSDGGAVLSTAIDRYLYVTVKRHDPLFQEQFRLNYSVTEHVNHVDEIENDIARECLRFLRAEPPIYVGVIADLPSSSGLGSSSSFAVGLLNALHRFHGRHASANQLAEEAAYIEMTILGRPIGKQDHYAAAFGGMNYFRFLPDGRVSIEPSQPRPVALRRIFDHLMMFWTNRQRDASKILEKMRHNLPLRMDHLRQLRDLADEIRVSMTGECMSAEIGRVLDQNWDVKKRLASCISNDEVDRWYQKAMSAGAFGGKLCGAGGGGFLLFVVEPRQQPAVRIALQELTEVSIGFDAHGSQVLHAV